MTRNLLTASAGFTFFSRPIAMSVYRVRSWASSRIITLRIKAQQRTELEWIWILYNKSKFPMPNNKTCLAYWHRKGSTDDKLSAFSCFSFRVLVPCTSAHCQIIHSSIIYLSRPPILWESQAELQPILADTGREARCTLDRSPAYRQFRVSY